MNELTKVDTLHPQEQHSALVILLDTSGSMNDDNKIGQLNEGLAIFKEDLMRNDLCRKRLDLAIITFGSDVALVQDFSPISDIILPTLRADGETSMGNAIIRAIELVEDRKSEYERLGISYCMPLIFMITDGEPTDMSPGSELWNLVTQVIRFGEGNKKFLFFAVGVEPVNMEILKELFPKGEPQMSKCGHFDDLFVWLSRSQGNMCKSGDQMAMPDPTGWGNICV